MEKLVNVQEILKALNVQECIKMTLNTGKPSAKRMQVSRMRKGDYTLGNKEVRHLHKELVALFDTLEMAIEEIEKEYYHKSGFDIPRRVVLS